MAKLRSRQHPECQGLGTPDALPSHMPNILALRFKVAIRSNSSNNARDEHTTSDQSVRHTVAGPQKVRLLATDEHANYATSEGSAFSIKP